MEKCLLTKLEGVADNDNLHVLGAIDLQVVELSTPTNSTQYILATGGTIEVPSEHPISGALLDNGTYKATIADKYHLTQLSIDAAAHFKNEGLEALQYCTGLTLLGYRRDKNKVGDIAYLSNLTLLEKLYLQGTNISGDIANLANMTSLIELQIDDSNISGDIANLANMTALKKLTLSNAKNIIGDIANLANMTSLIELTMSNCENVSGDISAFANMRDLTFLLCNGTSISGNIESLGNLTSVTEFVLHKTNVTGTVEGFVEGQVAAGRTSCALPIHFHSLTSLAKFGGVKRETDPNIFNYISWESTSKIVVYVGTNSGYNNATTVYAKGATSEEISAWQSAGKTVVVIS